MAAISIPGVILSQLLMQIMASAFMGVDYVFNRIGYGDLGMGGNTTFRRVP